MSLLHHPRYHRSRLRSARRRRRRRPAALALASRTKHILEAPANVHVHVEGAGWEAEPLLQVLGHLVPEFGLPGRLRRVLHARQLLPVCKCEGEIDE